MAEHGPDTLGQGDVPRRAYRAVGGALRVIIGLSVLILVFAGAACGRAYWLAQRWSRAFNSVAVGDSRALVEQAMGEPRRTRRLSWRGAGAWAPQWPAKRVSLGSCTCRSRCLNGGPSSSTATTGFSESTTRSLTDGLDGCYHLRRRQ